MATAQLMLRWVVSGVPLTTHNEVRREKSRVIEMTMQLAGLYGLTFTTPRGHTKPFAALAHSSIWLELADAEETTLAYAYDGGSAKAEDVVQLPPLEVADLLNAYSKQHWLGIKFAVPAQLRQGK